MTHKISTTCTTPLRTFAAIGAVLFSTMLFAACSGGPQAALPFAPSALQSSSPALEAADGTDAWDALGGKGKDPDKGKNPDKGKGRDEEDSDDDKDSDSPAAATTLTIEGVISSATGSCPTRTFVVGTRSVVTDAATTFKGGLCAQLAALAEVEVRAVRRADGTLLAKGVEFEDAAADDGKQTNDKWQGAVSGLTLPATCPAITFVVATRTVVTSAATVFQGGTCVQVLNGVNVRVRGTLQTNGTVLATRVDITAAEEDDDEDSDGNPHHGAGPHHGTVSSFRGVCPTVTFNLKGLTIVASATTTYVGGTCATLRPNVQVVVTGTLAAERRTFKAATIIITRTH